MLVYWAMFAVFAGAALIAKPVQHTTGPQSQNGLTRAYSRIWRAAAAGFLIAIIGLRYGVGGDWDNYLGSYHESSGPSLLDTISQARMEPGYIALNWAAAQTGAGIWLVNVVCATIFTIGLLRLCDQQPNRWLAVAVATPYLIIVVAMGFTRQAVAIGALMLAIADLIEKRSIKRFILFTAFGSLFHKTVLVFVPVFLVTTTRNRLGAILLGATAAALGYVLVLHGGTDIYQAGYLRATLDAAGARVRVLMNITAAVILFVSGNRFYNSWEERRVWRTFAYLAILAGALLPFVQSNAIVDRLAMYLIPLQLFVFSRLGYSAPSRERPQYALVALVILYSAAVLYVWLNFAVNARSWLPYDNYLWKSSG